MSGSTPPAQIAYQGVVQRGRGRKELVVDGVLPALFAHMIDKLFYDLAIGLTDALRIGGDFEAGLFQVLEEDVAVEGEVELGGVQQVKDDDVVALEAEEAEPLEDLVVFVQQVRYQDHQPPPLHLPRDLQKDLSHVGFSRRPLLLQRAQDLHQVAPFRFGRDQRYDTV